MPSRQAWPSFVRNVECKRTTDLGGACMFQQTAPELQPGRSRPGRGLPLVTQVLDEGEQLRLEVRDLGDSWGSLPGLVPCLLWRNPLLPSESAAFTPPTPISD